MSGISQVIDRSDCVPADARCVDERLRRACYLSVRNQSRGFIYIYISVRKWGSIGISIVDGRMLSCVVLTIVKQESQSTHFIY